MHPPAHVADLSAQSEYSSPGSYGELLAAIDPSIEAVSAVARNVIVHYRESDRELPESSREDINLRWIDAILATDQGRHGKALTEERSEEDRVQGCCRDHSLLSVAILRHHGIPARTRVGFAGYFAPNWHTDHVIVEAWIDDRWRRFDPEVADSSPSLPDPTDIPIGPGSPFVMASEAWLGHRNGSLDVSRFGVAGDFGFNGDWFVFDYVHGEVAHRFGHELLLWDLWGAMTTDLSHVTAGDLELIDEVAELSVDADAGDGDAERRLRDLVLANARLLPKGRVVCMSPTGNVWDVDLQDRSSSPLGA